LNDEVRTKEPAIRSGSIDTAAEQIVVEVTAPHLARELESAGYRRRTVDRLHHQDAVGLRFRARAAGIGDMQKRVSGRSAAADD
jgi:hypothetical protein